MKKLIFTFALLISFVSKADQLAYITKTQAEQAKEKIEKKTYIYFFDCVDLENSMLPMHAHVTIMPLAC